MTTQRPYAYGEDQLDDQDPYARKNNPDNQFSEPINDTTTVPRQDAGPQPYQNPDSPDEPQKRPPTFTEMQAEGVARPPMPEAAPIEAGPGPQVISETVDQFTPPAPEQPVPPSEPPPGSQPGWEGSVPSVPHEPAMLPDGIPIHGDGGGSSLDMLSTLLSGVNGTGRGSDVGNATSAAALRQLNNPSPYNADEVKAEYGDLAGGIDADYDSRIRGLDESMARRGLYGSTGKDFHSGRLADTEIGRRTAKTNMARDLAKNYATSYGNYNANAINQGTNVSNAENGNTLDWLKTLFGYGQQGFENDMTTARFNADQNSEYQRLLQAMLAAGYGG